MIAFEKNTLANGLQVIVHPDTSANVAVLNVIYNVGSRNEKKEQTGFAHLFEHLMFGGSKNIPAYDEALQKVGGENNAFTTPDVTNYYLTVPASNLETGFWLESDRMLSLSFDPDVLTVQKKVVIEEFKQRYLNQPYGNVWHKLRELAYKVHPYSWPTIGKGISHIERASMDDVKTFFKKFYVPNNAILVVGGNVVPDQIFALAEKWFGDIQPGKMPSDQIPMEPKQLEKRSLEVRENVPVDAFYKVYHMCGKTATLFYATDLMGDILGRGKSSRLYNQLVEKEKIFESINAYITGSIDPGLLVISGNLRKGQRFERAELAVDNITNKMVDKRVGFGELNKVKNQALSSSKFGRVEVMNRTLSLAMNAILGDPDMINHEDQKIMNVSEEDIFCTAQEVLNENNSSTIYYQAAN